MGTQADLALFYIPLPKGMGKIGEEWNSSSYLQALGFLVLVIGTVVYGKGDEELEKRKVCTALSDSLPANVWTRRTLALVVIRARVHRSW